MKTPTLSALLLSAGELGRTLGAPALKQGTMFDSMESMSTLTLSELRCSPVIFGVFDEQYRGSGYRGLVGVLTNQPDGPLGGARLITRAGCPPGCPGSGPPSPN